MQSFLEIYQNIPSHINPELIQLGIFSIRWYSIGYVLAFITVFGLILWRIKKGEFDSKKFSKETIQEISLDVFLVGIFSMMIGARLGYFLFYDWQTVFTSPLEVFIPGIDGFYGFSFHGGLIGMLLGIYFYCQKNKISLKAVENLFLPAIPLGLFWGRLGNFFNNELWGHLTSMPWGMRPKGTTSDLYHPSQLYEALGEGVIIFVVLWLIRNKPWAQNNFLSLFLILYGIIRFGIEFFRVSPPEHIILNALTIGQILCFGMIIIGTYIFKRHKKQDTRNKQISN